MKYWKKDCSFRFKKDRKKKQNLSNKDVEEIKRLNNLTTHGIKKLAKIRGIKNYDD